MTRQSHASRLATPVGERDHVQGAITAPATLVEYGDFECPYCGQAHAVVKALQERFGPRLRFAFRHFPLASVHPHAQAAAEAAEAAGAQGSFWEMHDILFENQEALDVDDLARYSDALGLDTPRLLSELDEHVYTPRVHEDFLDGARSGVNGTPTFFINGVRHDDANDVDTLVDAIEEVIEAATGVR